MEMNASGTRLFQSIHLIITGYSEPTVLKPHHFFCKVIILMSGHGIHMMANSGGNTFHNVHCSALQKHPDTNSIPVFSHTPDQRISMHIISETSKFHHSFIFSNCFCTHKFFFNFHLASGNSGHQARACLPCLHSNEKRKRHHGNAAIHNLCFLDMHK